MAGHSQGEALPLRFEQQQVAVADGLQPARGILLQAGFEQAANLARDGAEIGLFLDHAGQGFGEVFASE